MRRLLVGLTASVTFTGTVLVLPVYASPSPEPQPVTTSADLVPMGSVEDPARGADVQDGTTEPVAGVAETAPVLTVTRTDVAPFSLVGVTWAPDPAVDDTVVQIRVRDADGEWGDWSEVAVEDFDQDPHVSVAVTERRGGTAPLWTGPSTGVEAELVTRSGAQPTDVQLDLIDPGTSPADAALDEPAMGDTAHAAMAMPSVYSRAQWGADESLRTWAPEYPPTLKAATIHHTDTSNTYTAADVPGIVRSIYRYHAVSRGWGDIGYNVIADRFGSLWEGRYGGLSSTVVGAHAGGFNTGTVGVAMLGDYDTAMVPTVQLDAVAQIIAWKFSLYGIDPRGSATLVSGGGGTAKYPAGTSVTLPTVFAHSDVGNTSCPGASGYSRMGEVRERVVTLLDGQAEPTMAARYADDPALQTQLGQPIGSEEYRSGVSWQQYEHGYMYWTPTTGAHVVAGQIWGVYMEAGGPAVLGAPITDELPTPDGVGRYNHFANGSSIYWTAATQAQAVHGHIRNLWQRTGWEKGPLGYPTAGEVGGWGGRYSTFQGGAVHWTAAAGAVAVHGEIADRWQELGGFSWAVPTRSTQSVGTTTGESAAFAGDRAIYWSPATGAHEVQGQILARWTAKGGPTGVLGYPTSGERYASGGVAFTTFQNGIVYWTASGGTRVLEGSIARKWMALGALGSGFGLPTTDETATPDLVGRYNHFANGSSIYWSPASGAQSVSGQIRGLWGALGWERGLLGYPTSDERPTADGAGRYNTFQAGSVFWKPSLGAHAVYGSIHARYVSLGGVTSRLGYPVTSEYAVAGGRANDFEHGRISWNARTGAVTVTYR